ncbi:MAG: hypothetical protein WBN14_15555, partial [Polyangiales bacterium]
MRFVTLPTGGERVDVVRKEHGLGAIPFRLCGYGMVPSQRLHSWLFRANCSAVGMFAMPSGREALDEGHDERRRPAEHADRSLRHVDVLPPRRVETLLAHPRHRGGIAREQGRAINRAGRAPVGR